MALSERTEHTITLAVDGRLEVRAERIILDDEKEINRLFSRYVVEPDIDPTTITVPRVKQLADTFWTKDVVDTYVAKKKKRQETTFGSVSTVEAQVQAAAAALRTK